MLNNPQSEIPDPKSYQWIEAGIVADESLGRPAYRTAEEGIKEMELRIKFLEDENKQKLDNREYRKQIGTPTSKAYDNQIDLMIAKNNSLILEAKERLTAYRTQLVGRN